MFLWRVKLPELLRRVGVRDGNALTIILVLQASLSYGNRLHDGSWPYASLPTEYKSVLLYSY